MARGLAARDVGDLFVDDQNNEWRLSDIKYFGNESSIDTLNDKIDTFKKNSGVKDLNIINEPNTSCKAALYFSFESDNKEKEYLRYFKSFKDTGLKFSWGGKQLRESTGLRIHSDGAGTEHIPIKPSDILTTDEPVQPAELIQLINEKVELPDDFRLGVSDILNNIHNNNHKKFTAGMAKHQTVVEKYIGEYAAPIYMLQNQHIFEGEVKFNQIHFPLSGNYPLVDSFVVDDDGYKVGLSSKGGISGGAAASVKTIDQIYKKSIPLSHDIYKDAKDVIDSIQIISENSMIDGPLLAAQRYGFITEEETDLITYYIDSNKKEPDGVIPDSITRMMKTIKPNMLHKNYSIGLHMLSGVARSVCSYLNEHPKTTDVFKTAFKEHNFLQVYAYTQKSGDALRFSRFSVVDPTKFDGKIVFSAAKPYMATTKPKGKITFKIIK